MDSLRRIPLEHFQLLFENAPASLLVLLELYGYDVEVAADGEEGLQQVRAAQPDVAIVDIGLPGLDGYEVARRIRSIPDGSKVRLVALSGYRGADVKAQAMNAGFNLHLAKPVNPADLQNILDAWQGNGSAH